MAIFSERYAYDAYTRAVELASALGYHDSAPRWQVGAQKMREAILNRFWMPARKFFAEALDGRKNQVDAITSNPGHLLWSGVLSEEYAAKVAAALFSDEMFSGYGIRTMASSEGGYNPISYHNGSVWPHDNSLILLGLSRYGFRAEVGRGTNALLEALSAYSDDRLPELFAGHPAAQYETPVEYPTANRPQAWASGAVILLVRAILGLQVNSLKQEVTLAPAPLRGMTYLELQGVTIGGGSVDIRMEVSNGEARAEIRNLPSHWKRAA